jgi:hypothetical protein
LGDQIALQDSAWLNENDFFFFFFFLCYWFLVFRKILCV